MPKRPIRSKVPQPAGARSGAQSPPPANPRAPAQRRAALASHYRARFRTGGGR